MDISAPFLKNLLDHAKASAPTRQADYRPASVFLLFFNLENPCILAIQKADTEGYPWRNQVALPGGHVDQEDGSRLAAAFRELEEEVNILQSSVAFVGSLGHFQTVRQMDVEVFLGIWDETSEISHEEAEISRILTIPYSITLMSRARAPDTQTGVARRLNCPHAADTQVPDR